MRYVCKYTLIAKLPCSEPAVVTACQRTFLLLKLMYVILNVL